MIARGRSLHLVLAAALAAIVAVASCADPAPPPRGGQSLDTGPRPALSPEDARAVLAAIDRQSTERQFALPNPPSATAPAVPSSPVPQPGMRPPQPEPDPAAPLAAAVEQAGFASTLEATFAKRGR